MEPSSLLLNRIQRLPNPVPYTSLRKGGDAPKVVIRHLPTVSIDAFHGGAGRERL
jgi:hypothetical protein